MWITVVQVQIISSIKYSDYLHVDIVFIPFWIFFFLFKVRIGINSNGSKKHFAKNAII